MSLYDDLTAVADLLESEGAWTQGTSALDAMFREVSPTDPRACAWCLAGAINAVALRISYANREMRAILQDEIQTTITRWNDAPGRTQAEVVALVRRAAEAAR